MRITVADAISPSYFVTIAAVQLGFFKEEGVDMEFVFPPADPSQAPREGVVDFYGGSPYTGLHAFPRLAGRRRPVRPFALHLLVPGGPLRSEVRARRRQCEMVAHASRFAREMGVLEGDVRYGELVATQFASLWQG